jgi:hypothetical protein
MASAAGGAAWVSGVVPRAGERRVERACDVGWVRE